MHPLEQLARRRRSRRLRPQRDNQPVYALLAGGGLVGTAVMALALPPRSTRALERLEGSARGVVAPNG